MRRASQDEVHRCRRGEAVRDALVVVELTWIRCHEIRAFLGFNRTLRNLKIVHGERSSLSSNDELVIALADAMTRATIVVFASSESFAVFGSMVPFEATTAELARMVPALSGYATSTCTVNAWLPPAARPVMRVQVTTCPIAVHELLEPAAWKVVP